MMNRRKFLKSTLIAGGGLAAVNAFKFPPVLNHFENAYALQNHASLSWVEANYYKKLKNKEIECQLCPRKCLVGDRERGYCGVRENKEGIYYTLVHSYVCSAAIDPIEKKPFFHFLPGTTAFSIATAGCNLNCKFCQNWEISQVRPEQADNKYLPPLEVADIASGNNCRSIAYTYSEPTVFYEYMLDCAKEGKKKGIRSVMVSAGYINNEPLIELCKELDAVKIDFKGFTEKYYNEVCHGKLKPVMDTLVALKKIGVWFEIVYLMVPTLNDDMKNIQEMCRWMLTSLGPDVPVHFTRFTPLYLLKNLPPTPVSSLEKAAEIAQKTGLHYVYIGNVPGHTKESTYCPNCTKMLIGRYGFNITEMNLNQGKCKFCNHPIPGVWE
jgi:pyruvate formate lyase activating enzyme